MVDFLCHTSKDKAQVHEEYQRLTAIQGCKP